MKHRIAELLRRMADRLDPPAQAGFDPQAHMGGTWTSSNTVSAFTFKDPT